LSLNPNSSEDYKIKIKGLDNIKVGDFTYQALDPESSFGSLTAVDIVLVEAVQAKLVYRKVAKSVTIAGRKDIEDKDDKDDKGDKDDKDDKNKYKVFILRYINTQLQIQVNRYYTAEELASLDDNIEAIEVVELGYYTNNTCNTDKEVDDEPPDYNSSDDDNKFDNTIEGDQDTADENID
jgi:hypothetical protein